MVALKKFPEGYPEDAGTTFAEAPDWFNELISTEKISYEHAKEIYPLIGQDFELAEFLLYLENVRDLDADVRIQILDRIDLNIVKFATRLFDEQGMPTDENAHETFITLTNYEMLLSNWGLLYTALRKDPELIHKKDHHHKFLLHVFSDLEYANQNSLAKLALIKKFATREDFERKATGSHMTPIHIASVTCDNDPYAIPTFSVLVQMADEAGYDFSDMDKESDGREVAAIHMIAASSKLSDENKSIALRSLISTKSADIDQLNDHNRGTALFYCINRRCEKSAETLLNAGADPSIAGHSRYEPSAEAMKNNLINLFANIAIRSGSSRKEYILKQIDCKLKGQQVDKIFILDLFKELNKPEGKFSELHQQKHASFDAFRLFFRSNRNVDESGSPEKFWHTKSYQSAVKMLKEAYLKLSDVPTPSGRETEENKFIDYIRGNTPISLGETSTRQQFKRAQIR